MVHVFSTILFRSLQEKVKKLSEDLEVAQNRLFCLRQEKIRRLQWNEERKKKEVDEAAQMEKNLAALVQKARRRITEQSPGLAPEAITAIVQVSRLAHQSHDFELLL